MITRPILAVSAPARDAMVAFDCAWHILGPFQIGTREWQWGADPLEAHGGFHKLESTSDADFASSLSANGSVKWLRKHVASWCDINAAKADVNIGFPDIDWEALRSTYGWAAVQWQAWCRGSFHVQSEDGNSQTFEIYTDQIVEFWIDDQRHFGGDFYTYRRAPLVVHLAPGRHVVKLRLVREVRSMGGVGVPNVEACLEIKAVDDIIQIDVGRTALVADVVDGKLASPYASIAVRNTGTEVQEITGVRLENGHGSACMLARHSLMLYPGQTRPVAFQIELPSEPPDVLHVELTIKVSGQESEVSYAFTLRPQRRRAGQTHKITYLYPSGIVSYAMLRAPPLSSAKNASHALPVMVMLHGAGLDADNEEATHALDAVADLAMWTSMPSGVTSWSGDDWHEWGWRDVEAAVAAIPDWIARMKWQASGVNIRRILLTGHSNGGQGVWYGLTHHPDRVIAAAESSGYTSIQKYVPYVFWTETSPRKEAVLQSVLASYRHELLLDNARGIPLFVQHGEADTNVPVFHARRMQQLAKQKGLSVEYNEIPGADHYFQGIMTTEAMKQFYKKHIETSCADRRAPTSFTLQVANPAEQGPLYGFSVTQLSDPGQLGLLQVESLNQKLTIRSSNVASFDVAASAIKTSALAVDGQDMEFDHKASNTLTFVRDDTGSWQIDRQDGMCDVCRTNNQLGSMSAILRSQGLFHIVCSDSTTVKIAVQISRNMYQYFHADAEISFSDHTGGFTEGDSGNSVLLGAGQGFSINMTNFPISIKGNVLHLRQPGLPEVTYASGQSGLAAIFVSPLGNDRLQLVVWGCDIPCLELAARLVPLVAGAAQPDFVVLTRQMAWRGIEGTLAMGFFDHQWRVTRSSFIT